MRHPVDTEPDTLPPLGDLGTHLVPLRPIPQAVAAEDGDAGRTRDGPAASREPVGSFHGEYGAQLIPASWVCWDTCKEAARSGMRHADQAKLGTREMTRGRYLDRGYLDSGQAPRWSVVGARRSIKRAPMCFKMASMNGLWIWNAIADQSVI